MVTFGPVNTLNMSAMSATVDVGRCVSRETVATGFRPLDRLLPAGGVRRGSLVEWLAADCTVGLGGLPGRLRSPAPWPVAWRPAAWPARPPLAVRRRRSSSSIAGAGFIRRP